MPPGGVETIHPADGGITCARTAATFELGKRREIIALIARLVADGGQAVIPGEIEQTIRGDVEALAPALQVIFSCPSASRTSGTRARSAVSGSASDAMTLIVSATDLVSIAPGARVLGGAWAQARAPVLTCSETVP